MSRVAGFKKLARKSDDFLPTTSINKRTTSAVGGSIGTVAPMRRSSASMSMRSLGTGSTRSLNMPKPGLSSSASAQPKSMTTMARAKRRYGKYKDAKKEVRLGKNQRGKVQRELDILNVRKRSLRKQLARAKKAKDIPLQNKLKKQLQGVETQIKNRRTQLSGVNEEIKKAKIKRNSRFLGNKGRSERSRKLRSAGMRGGLGALGATGAAMAGMGLLGAGAASSVVS